MISEREVARSWGQIFGGGNVNSDSFERAEHLLEELRNESPLRHRLTLELEELRTIHRERLSVAAGDA